MPIRFVGCSHCSPTNFFKKHFPNGETKEIVHIEAFTFKKVEN